MPLNEYQKIAVILTSLTDDQCVEILKNFKEEEVEMICRELLTANQIDSQEREAALVEFHQSFFNAASAPKEGIEFLEGILPRIYGIRRATALLGNIREQDEAGMNLNELVAEVGPMVVAEELQTEYPQVMSTVLTALKPQTTAEILTFFTEEMQADALKAIVESKAMSTELMNKIKRGFTEKLLLRKQVKKKIPKDKLKTTAEILSFMPRQDSSKALDNLRKKDAALTKTVEEAMASRKTNE